MKEEDKIIIIMMYFLKWEFTSTRPDAAMTKLSKN